ncbi:hypothetical protein WJX73_004680 [Symbiochloris irregularis]|uniref:Poly A polymerase head domain-containing protein n=1 Tax=Symbiochloris irregularis TaxID=706552 RepID=A0AAW1P987_9CHLO
MLKAVLVSQSLHGTELRCAGGWVRDKLLGKESHDIDIALNNMMGEDFAAHVNEHLTSRSEDLGKIAVFKRNPEQSKHLQTARMKVGSLELDLVNLRSETYTDSRIPTQAFGTPEEDALRRDFTINSLFYNITTNEVEDWTGRGQEDLQSGLIRTPLPASETFMDDPLRVLRAVRFAARFGFTLDEELQAAAASPQLLLKGSSF